MAVRLLQQGAPAGDAFGEKYPITAAALPTAVTAPVAGTVYALNSRKGHPITIMWEKRFPGTKPASIDLRLEGNDLDPTDANSWYQLDKTTDVTANELRAVNGFKPLWIRENLIAIGTPAGGVSGTLYAG